jgi:hypothetical protein
MSHFSPGCFMLLMGSGPSVEVVCMSAADSSLVTMPTLSARKSVL